MQRIKGFVLGKLNNVSGQNSFSAEVIEGEKRKDCFLFGNCRSCFLWLVWNVCFWMEKVFVQMQQNLVMFMFDGFQIWGKR